MTSQVADRSVAGDRSVPPQLQAYNPAPACPFRRGPALARRKSSNRSARAAWGGVYRARDSRLERDVALKVLPDMAASDPEWRNRFEREGRALASLNHSNIAAIYRLEQGPPQPAGLPTAVIVMELVDGETLAERLRRGPLPLDEALRVAGQIAAALEAAHERGIVHRDLKPANVKITSAGDVKVLDFGLAKFMADPALDGATRSGTTVQGAVLGTPAYMAPEQAQGRSVDQRVDVWAFGVVLFEIVTGERLFRGESLQETLTAVLTADPPLARVPPVLQPLLRACLERDPRKRLRDIGDHRFLLVPPAEVPVNHRWSGARWPLVVTGAMAAVLLAFFAGTFAQDDNVGCRRIIGHLHAHSGGDPPWPIRSDRIDRGRGHGGGLSRP